MFIFGRFSLQLAVLFTVLRIWWYWCSDQIRQMTYSKQISRFLLWFCGFYRLVSRICLPSIGKEVFLCSCSPAIVAMALTSYILSQFCISLAYPLCLFLSLWISFSWKREIIYLYLHSFSLSKQRILSV